MSDDDTMSIEDVGIKFSYELDQKSQKKTEQGFENMLGLLRDLGIVAKIAGDTLGKVWDGLQKQMEVGVKGMQTYTTAAAMGFTAEQHGRLASGMGAAGLGDENAPKIEAAVNSFIAALDDEALGATPIERMYETLGRATDNISESLKEAIVGAGEAGDENAMMQLIAQAINQAGDRGSELAGLFGMDSFAGLENDASYQKFVNALIRNTTIYDKNTEAFADISEDAALFKASIQDMSDTIAVAFEPALDDMGKMMQAWAESLKDNLGPIFENLRSWQDDRLAEQIQQNAEKYNRRSGYEGGDAILKGALDTMGGWFGKMYDLTNAEKLSSYLMQSNGIKIDPELLRTNVGRGMMNDVVGARGEMDAEALVKAMVDYNTNIDQGDLIIRLEMDGDEVVQKIIHKSALNPGPTLEEEYTGRN